MEWISTEGVLPEFNEKVLLLIVYQKFDGGAYNETVEICIGWRENSPEGTDWALGNQRIMWDYDYNLQFTEDDITHWMPLPNPPEKEQ